MFCAGVLLHGPPGTGKSLLAASLGAELGAGQFTVAGPELLSKFHGETEVGWRWSVSSDLQRGAGSAARRVE